MGPEASGSPLPSRIDYTISHRFLHSYERMWARDSLVDMIPTCDGPHSRIDRSCGERRKTGAVIPKGIAMLSIIRRLAYDEDGESLVEYGLGVALISLVAIVGITTLGSNLRSLFSSGANSI